jgi:lysophospholipase L1-like esterase
MKLLVFGDSIARGALDSEYGGRVERLKAHFLGEYNESEISVYNLSVSSNDSLGVLKYMEQDIEKILDIEPESLAIIIAIGSNDARLIDTKVAVSQDIFHSTIDQIIKLSKKYTNKVALMGLFPIDEKRVNPRNKNEYHRNKDFKIYDEMLRNSAWTNEIGFIDVWNIIWSDDLSDGLHPDTTGHQMLYVISRERIAEMGWDDTI